MFFWLLSDEFSNGASIAWKNAQDRAMLIQVSAWSAKILGGAQKK
jgi:hypothetical protein